MQDIPQNQKSELPKSKRMLMEDVNVVRLEGRYFCFHGREAAKRINATLSFENPNGSVVTVETGKRGQPSVLAYRLLQAIFRQITLCDRPYPSQVAFTRRELGRLVGRDSFGGRDAQDILRALYQLQDTHIMLSGDAGKTHFSDNRFNLLVQVYSIWEKDEHALRRQGALDAIAIELHPAVMRNIAKGQIAIFNWPALEKLEPLQAALYKRLYLHFSNLFEMQGKTQQGQNPRSLVFEKAYAAICEEWLGGLQRYRFKSDIEKQLLPHLTPLTANGFLARFSIEPKSKGDGFKLTFKPGPGFFADYDQFYRMTFTKKPVDAAPLTSGLSQSIALVQQFYKATKGAEHPENSLAKGDIAYAEELISLLGQDGATAFITYGVDKARLASFPVATIRGLKLYVPDWHTEQQRRERQAQLDAARESAATDLHMQRAYDEFLSAHIERHLATLAETQRAELMSAAEATVLATYGKGLGFTQMVKNQLQRAVLTASPVPDFETWAKQQKR